jgi:GDP/UDP-N,N'-diacetylbacillosamine 2-epimerase (hydrolysing)
MSALAQPLRKIIYLSGTRADFGLMQSSLLLLAMQADLSIAVTGMHLAPGFGQTMDAVRASGLRICGEVPVDVTSRTANSMSVGIGQCLMGITALLQREQPDMLVLLGDRGEMLAGAIAALHLGIVCVHIHGGERSGTVDEPIRHAISKLSHYHLVATAESKERLIRMGEQPGAVHITGAPGLDGLAVMADKLINDVKAAVGLPLDPPFILTVFHPVVQQATNAYTQTSSLLLALKKAGLPVIWIEPNADAGSNDILKALADMGLPAGSKQFKHIDRNLFVAAMRYCAVMLGNSSAGIIEAASFATPVINVGDRQRLREKSANVIDVTADADAIYAAITSALRVGKVPCDNSYGDGVAGPRIAHLLTTLSLDSSVLDKSNSY